MPPARGLQPVPALGPVATFKLLKHLRTGLGLAPFPPGGSMRRHARRRPMSLADARAVPVVGEKGGRTQCDRARRVLPRQKSEAGVRSAAADSRAGVRKFCRGRFGRGCEEVLPRHHTRSRICRGRTDARLGFLPRQNSHTPSRICRGRTSSPPLPNLPRQNFLTPPPESAAAELPHTPSRICRGRTSSPPLPNLPRQNFLTPPPESAAAELPHTPSRICRGRTSEPMPLTWLISPSQRTLRGPGLLTLHGRPPPRAVQPPSGSLPSPRRAEHPRALSPKHLAHPTPCRRISLDG